MQASQTVETAGTTGARKVSTSRGTMRSDLSVQWCTRPDDQRFLNLDELFAHTNRRRERSAAAVVPATDLPFGYDPGRDEIGLAFDGQLMPFTNWSFGQYCSHLGAPGNFLRRLPLGLVVQNLQAAATLNRSEQETMAYYTADGDPRTRAITSGKYGRIYDAEVVDAVRRMTRSSDVEWKVPGVMSWGTGSYDPNVAVTKQTTTLFASDRDVFMFLCDDLTPIEVGKLPNGDPDLMFRGFIVSNSEVGKSRLYVATMYLRAVCANRCLWGVEGFREVKIVHSAHAPQRFIDEVQPALARYTAGDPQRVVEGVEQAKETVLAKSTEKDSQVDFLVSKLGFAKGEAEKIVGAAEECEQHPPATAWDFAQGITAYAQTTEHQDRRFALEQKAGTLLDKVIA